ncbi:imidazole glycerol phosphate synthase subunit HisF [Prochlorococcus marinus XMU1412]|uniref:HisA/HisF-related TIM barrel protein n=1 Tax=Prochlorococcus marinus TaxID=1219 RepID=UPI001ADABE72|nr:HisA/HisF-related TIM barrel protein [Prochlorococcus marinus]MBO8240524.1 imidazole glycerol phosphate synthase subunit HisF [Prochlorococcus marinus XMU1412]MBW3071758.1 imidazole glycerol phosphate synthase subunit HisF [Prochlorococcus marinus str. MU1412]
MLRKRLIVSLLIDNERHLVNTVNFTKRHYIGDPLNASYIFSDYEVDELLVLDIDAATNNRCIPYAFVQALSNFTTVPLSVGGGIKNSREIKDLLSLGVEKVVIGENLNDNFNFLREASSKFGSSSITAILNVKKSQDGTYNFFSGKKKIPNNDIIKVACKCQDAGAGELIINNIDRDGKKNGYDIDLMSRLNSKLKIPLVALGGCGNTNDIKELINKTNISGIACSTLFVYATNTKNVLLKYGEIKEKIEDNLT